MEKKEQELRNVVYDWCCDDYDNKYRDTEELVDEYSDIIRYSEGLDKFGYTVEDKDEIENIIRETVESFKADNEDTADIAEQYDGGYETDKLSDEEWREVFENNPDIYINALYKRANYMDRDLPDELWEYLEMSANEGIGFTQYSPDFVFDNIAFNGEYGDFDEFKDEDETDEEFVQRMEGNCLWLDKEKRFIIIQL